MKYLLPLLFLLSSCSTVKKVNKSDTETDTKIKTEVNETTQTKTESDTKDKTVTTIEADTVVNVPIIQKDGEVVTQKIPVKFKKTIIRDEEKKVITTKKSDSTATVKEKKKEEVKEKIKDVKRSGFPWWIWLIVALIITASVLWWIKKKAPPL